MAQHKKLIGLMQPMERFARAVNSASDTARSTGTSPSGSVYIPNGDGTGTLIGVAAGVDETGAPQGRVDFVNDTTPPSMPTGVSYSTGDGRIHAFWDGTLTDGVPADFAHVEFYAGEAFMGRLVKAGSLTWEAVTGTAYRCTACAVDVQGNESEATEAVEVTVTDTVAEVNADVAEVKEKAAALETELDTTNQKVAQVASDVDGVKTSVTNAVEKAEESLTVATSAQQTATEVKTTADKAYSDAESALTQSSEAKQTASELSGKVTEAVETANSAKTSATTAVQTVDSFKTEVSETYLTKDDAGTTYATKSSLTETADSITAKVEAAQATGDDALALAKGGISKVEVQYAQNQSTTTAPTAGWSTTAPTWKDGYYVWQKTVTTYKDGTTTESDPTCISGAKGATGAKGDTGATGAAGADGVGYKANLLLWSDYKNFDKLFYIGLWTAAKFDDGTYGVTDTGSTANAWSEIWQQSEQSVTDWDFKTRSKVTISIELKSADLQSLLPRYSLSVGVLGTTSDGATTREVDGDNLTLEKANHDTIANDTWVRFWYTKDVSSFVLDTTKYTKHIFCMLLKRISLKTTTDVPIYARRPMLVEGDQPAEWSYAASELVGNGVSSITPQYYLSTSATSCTGGSWSTTMPTWTSGTYIWTRSHVVYTDGTTADTEAVYDTVATDAGEGNAGQKAANAAISELNVTLEGITSRVSAVEGEYSSLAQTQDGFTAVIGNVQNELAKAQADATAAGESAASANSTAAQLGDELNSLANNVNSYMSFKRVGGQPVLELGASGSPFKVQITNTALNFMQDGTPIAYLSNRTLHITSGVMTDELRIGDESGYVWKYRANGHLGLRYVSE